MQLFTQCHPGWMYPPADIFIVGQRVASGCSQGESINKSNADQALARVLLHEMGHAIEFAMLKGAGGNDHFRAEAFASWFEYYASQYSSVINYRNVSADYAGLGLAGLEQGMSGYSFSSSPYDYGLGFLMIDYLVSKKNVSGLVRLYQAKISKGKRFIDLLPEEAGIKGDKLFAALKRHGEEYKKQ